jgi:hypothetical protein
MFEKMMKYKKAWSEFCDWLPKNSSFNFNNRIKEFEYGFEYTTDERDWLMILAIMYFFFFENNIITSYEIFEDDNKYHGIYFIDFEKHKKSYKVNDTNPIELLIFLYEKTFEIWEEKIKND